MDQPTAALVPYAQAPVDRGGADVGLPAALLPAHVRPLPGEVLTSWLVRLAGAHGLKLHTFCVLVWPGRQVWTRDFDRTAPGSFLVDLARRTGVPPERAAATHVDALAGRLFPAGDRGSPNGAALPPGASAVADGDRVGAGGGARPWVLRAGVRHRTRRRGWIQCCPACLAEDTVPYFRLVWRAACVTACPAHGRVLIERCPACRAPLLYFRGELGSRRRHAAPPMCVCPACGRDWRRDGRSSARRDVGRAEAAVHARLSAAMAGTPLRLPDAAVPAGEYFAVLRQLARVLLSPGRAGRSRALASADPSTRAFAATLARAAAAGRHEVETRALAERRAAVLTAASLLDGWPDRFLAACAEARVWSTDLLRDERGLPGWFADGVRDALYRPLPSGARRRAGRGRANPTDPG